MNISTDTARALLDRHEAACAAEQAFRPAANDNFSDQGELIDPAVNEHFGALKRETHASLTAIRAQGLPLLRLLFSTDAPAEPSPFQERVFDWVLTCFGPEIAADRTERHVRFLEEALELVQTLGCSRGEAQQVLGYVYDRPAGESAQEVGGVMVTLAALCQTHGIDLMQVAETELARVWTKIERVREKQAAKPTFSPEQPDTAAQEQRSETRRQLLERTASQLESLADHFAAGTLGANRNSDPSLALEIKHLREDAALLRADQQASTALPAAPHSGGTDPDQLREAEARYTVMLLDLISSEDVTISRAAELTNVSVAELRRWFSACLKAGTVDTVPFPEKRQPRKT